MTASVPASYFVNITPNVLSAGGTGLDLSGLFLTNSTRVPIGTVLTLTSAAAVLAYFGAGSTEYAAAQVYFAGPTNALIAPGAMLFAQYPTVAVPAYLRGGATGLTLAQLQAITSGTLIVTVQGLSRTSTSINLSSATSFSNAADLINNAFAYYDADTRISTTSGSPTITVTSVVSGTIVLGQEVTATGIPSGATITAFGTGTGGTGTYTISANATATATNVTAGMGTIDVNYDSTSGAFVFTDGTAGATSTIGFATGTLATTLGLTAATGAVTSQGAAIAVPGTAMDAVVAQTQNFATFTTIGFEPSTGDCVLFAAWNNGKSNRYLYVCWDTDSVPTLPNDTSSAGYLIRQASYSGTALIYEPSNLHLAAFLMGYVASLNFDALNGRRTAAYEAQSGITPAVTSQTILAQLIANGYNTYVSAATAAQAFQFFYPGSVTGPYTWIDSYVDQIWFNQSLQLALMTLLTSIGHIPYNDAGYAIIEQAMSDPINAALNYGAIVTGVPLTSVQAQAVAAATGDTLAASVITQRGWYLYIGTASGSVRAARSSPPIILFYSDGQSVQQINVTSTEVE